MGRFEGAESGTTQVVLEKLRHREVLAGPTRHWAAGPAPPPDHIWPVVSPLAPHTLLTEGREDGIGLWNNNTKIRIQRQTYSTWETEEILPPITTLSVPWWETIQTGWPLQVSALEMPLREALWAKIDRFVPTNTHALRQRGRQASSQSRSLLDWDVLTTDRQLPSPPVEIPPPLLQYWPTRGKKNPILIFFQWIMKRFI